MGSELFPGYPGVSLTLTIFYKVLSKIRIPFKNRTPILCPGNGTGNGNLLPESEGHGQSQIKVHL